MGRRTRKGWRERNVVKAHPQLTKDIPQPKVKPEICHECYYGACSHCTGCKHDHFADEEAEAE